MLKTILLLPVLLPGAAPAQTIGATRSVTSDERGAYRFPNLPPGGYRLMYELPGFQTVVREGIHVAVGFTATVDVQLGVQTIEETVTVVGASAGSQSQFVTYGTRAQNQPMIEGMPLSQIGSAGGSVTFYYDYGSFQDVSVNAAVRRNRAAGTSGSHPPLYEAAVSIV